MKTYLLISTAVAIAVSAYSVHDFNPKSEPQVEYILQGANQKTIVHDVNKAGGVVVHEYSVIDAVSVKLTQTQLEALKAINPMLRLFKDQKIEVTAKKSKKSKKAKKNKSASKNSWFAEYSWFEPINTVESTNAYAVEPAALLDIASAVLVESHNVLENSRDAALQLESNSEPVAGKVKFITKSNQMSWTVSNTAEYSKELSALSMRFPSSNQSLDTVTIDGIQVSFDELLSGEIALASPVILDEKQAFEISFGFNTLGSADMDDYSLVLNYSDAQSENVVAPFEYEMQGRLRDTYFPTLVRANLAHERGITGYGVTVAIIDTGIRDLTEIKLNSSGEEREITIVDVLDPTKNNGQMKRNDENGHGTHLASIILNSSESSDSFGQPTGGYNGIAPDANLVVVRAFDVEGQSSYMDILKAVEYVVENKDVLNIKVLNLSFSAPPSSYYWDDPLNQALMKAWDAGITVLASAGNIGPDAMTIGVPGNTPYVITVGAVSDNYTPDNRSDDFVTTFSSAGPTYEGFVKPELVAPGGHIQGVMDRKTLIRESHSIFNEKNLNLHNYFELSGSSQSTAVTSGIVALMLQANPNLTPDDVKCRLIATARVATKEDGNLAYSVFQQGAGLVDAMAAIESKEAGCANTGLSIADDISGDEHFIGPARISEDTGNFYIPGIEGLEWSGIYTDSQLWRNSGFNADSQLWRNSGFNSDSQLWRHTSFNSNSQLWRNSGFQADSQLWRNSGFNADSQLWRNSGFSSDSQLWRNSGFNSDSQLWRNSGFNSNSIDREWVDHE